MNSADTDPRYLELTIKVCGFHDDALSLHPTIDLRRAPEETVYAIADINCTPELNLH